MPAPWNLNPIDIVIFIFAIGIALRQPIAAWASRLMAGRPSKHELHSEIHGILMAVTAQAATTAQIRDAIAQLVAAMGKPDEGDTQHKQLNVLEQIRIEMGRLTSNTNSIGNSHAKHLEAISSAVLDAYAAVDVLTKLITDIKDSFASIVTPLQNMSINVSYICGPVGHDGVSRFSKMALATDSTLKFNQDQLDATRKLDDRLFEFVNATKRIMRAMEGTPGGDDDSLLESARDIRMRAADKGIDLTLEDSIKRAREQANFR